MSLALKAAAESGASLEPEKPVRAVRKSGSRSSAFDLAKTVSTESVLARLGLAVTRQDEKSFTTCVKCKNDDSLICEPNGGVACFHDTCREPGSSEKTRYRSNVDIVAERLGIEPLAAAQRVCEWNGIELPKPSTRAQDSAPFMPGDDEQELSPADSSVETAANVFAGRFREASEGLLLTKPPPRKYLLRDGRDGVLPLGKVGLVVAAGGVGKTLVECQFALAVVLGVPLFDIFPVEHPGDVLLALGEEDDDEIHRRLYSAAGAMGLSREQRQEAARRIVPLAMAGVNVALTSGDGSGNVGTTPARDHLLQCIKDADRDWRLIILDPLSRWAGNDVEKDNHAATRFIEVAEELTQVRGTPTVLVAHHSNKLSRGRDAGPGKAESARGASALTDGARWVANLDPEGDDVVIFRVTKSNYARKPEPLYLLRDPDFGGAPRRMSEIEIEQHRSAQAEEKPRQSGRARVTDAELDTRIQGVVAKHGLMSSIREYKRLGLKGEDGRLYERARALGLLSTAADSKTQEEQE